MRTVIKLEHVSKQFSEEQVLKDVSFEFQEGKIYGDRKSRRLNSSHVALSRMPSSA